MIEQDRTRDYDLVEIVINLLDGGLASVYASEEVSVRVNYFDGTGSDDVLAMHEADQSKRLAPQDLSQTRVI